MTTAYIDVDRRAGITAIPAPTATSTVTNEVRISWDITISRWDLHQTLLEVAQAVLDNEKFPQLANFTDT